MKFRAEARAIAGRDSRSFALDEELSRFGEFLLLRLVDLGVFQIQGLESIDDRRRDDDAGEPLIIRRHDIPRQIPLLVDVSRIVSS